MKESDMQFSVNQVVEAFGVLAKLWQLTHEESAQVLGMTTEEYEGLLANLDETGHSNADQQFIMKISLLASIHRAVMLFSANGAFNHFFNYPYAPEPLNGISIRQFIITNNDNDSLDRLERWAKLLLSGEIDVAIGPFVPDHINENLSFSPVTQDQIVFVARSEHPIFQQEKPFVLQQLKNYSSIGPEIPPNVQVNVPEEMLANIPTITSGNYNTAKSLTMRSDYITGGPQVLFQQEIDSGALKTIPGMPTPLWESYLLFKPESEHIPSVAKFIEVVNSLNQA